MGLIRFVGLVMLYTGLKQKVKTWRKNRVRRK